jgi:hypothetical protein
MASEEHAKTDIAASRETDNLRVNNGERNGASRGLYLQWEGKRVYRQRVPTPRLLERVEKFSFGEDRSNMLVEGDNLQVLASLKPRYTGQVDFYLCRCAL